MAGLGDGWQKFSENEPRHLRKARSQTVTNLTSADSALTIALLDGARGHFTDKGTLGVILGRKAKVFARKK